MVVLLYMKMIFVITEIVCIITGTSSALRKKNRSMRVPAVQYSVAPRTRFGSAIPGRIGNGGVTDYISKWVEAIPTRTNDASVVAKFLHSHIFTRFATPRELIIDGGTHFCNKMVDKVLQKYEVRHRTSLAYHPQENGQAEVSNREIKFIIEKTVNNSMKDWSKKIEGALWAYRTTFKTPQGMSPFRIVYGKACHLPVELENRAYWATRMLNMDNKVAGEKRMLQLSRLDEFLNEAYENARIYKEKTKAWHDKHIKRKEFEAG